jgi:hypothetical protein
MTKVMEGNFRVKAGQRHRTIPTATKISPKKVKPFKEAEVTANLVASLIMAVSFGFFESNSKGDAIVSNYVLFNHFSWWHVAMFATVFALGLSLMTFSLMRGDLFRAILVAGADVMTFAAVEDMMWFLFRNSWVGPNAWSTWSLGGIEIVNTFVPWIYLILLGAASIIYSIAYFK